MIRAVRTMVPLAAAVSLACVAAGCAGEDGPDGARGPEGPRGEAGPPGQPGASAIDPETPLSAVVALSFRDPGGVTDENGVAPTNLADYVKELVEDYATDTLGPVQFPLAAAATDSLRGIPGVQPNVVAKWLDPIAFAPGEDEVDLPRFGANNDYIAYFGDGWDDDWSGNVVASAPQYNGDDSAGWMWVNHEYISNDPPTASTAPTGQNLVLARFLSAMGGLGNDVFADVWSTAALDAYIQMYKKQLGGSYVRVIQDPATGEWAIDKAAGSIRYDATSSTLLTLSGISLSAADHDDEGNAAPSGVVVGIMGDCSGGQTPWGTVFTAEENVQDYYGDLEIAWGGNQEFIPGQGFDPGNTITFPFAPSPDGYMVGSDPTVSGHNRDFYGYLAEIDVGAPPGEYDGLVAEGVGHKKIGAMGRARWENATFVTGADWQLIPDQPIVFYSGNDRRSGRMYKFVSSQNYTAGMTRAEVRKLLDEGTVYVAHFLDLDHTTGNTLASTGVAPTEAAPGQGVWIEMSIDNTDQDAPNAAGLGAAGTKVGAALKDTSWNGIGGFATQEDVLWALFTAANKLGVSEMNRPEDLEWNPLDLSGEPRLYVAFTNHTRRVANDQDGVLYPPETHEEMSPLRTDTVGAIFALVEGDSANPAASTTFEYFEVWHGTVGKGDFDAADPDNIVIDAQGGVWFGTDGNFGTNGHADGFYYLDLDPAHTSTPTPTFGKAFRVMAVPSDAEATGPAFSAGMGTLFVSVQHPGESVYSSWPQRR
ncbi:alkaline phosphatase PhoX [Haliangium sp.]|uniref:alkaline phosphatase PhoX n=1 Tax=Haliangium sp. TaxID=2663208 RepID=UPI003D09D8D9